MDLLHFRPTQPDSAPQRFSDVTNGIPAANGPGSYQREQSESECTT